MKTIAKTIALFVLAAVCELGGTYLIWQWRNIGKTTGLALAGVVALFLSSFVQTAQSFTFGRMP